jgi:CheY-like chemotaxis protein
VTKALPIVLVEDDDNDVFLMRLGLKGAGVENELVVLRNGEEAIELLTKCENGVAPIPCLLITDIKMPRVDGFELLLWLQVHPHFRDVPKLVMSGSVLEEDLAKSLLLGATAYFTKPSALGELVMMVRTWKSAYLESGAGCRAKG